MEQLKDIITQIRVKYNTLSKSHKILADYIMKNPEDVTFMTISQFSQKTGVSPATITRFARQLEFQGYPELQRSVYEHQRKCVPFGQLKSLLRSEAPAGASAQNLLEWTIQNNIQQLEGLCAPELQESFFRSCEILSKARTIYIAGLRSSYAAAYYLAFMLQQICSNVCLLPTSNSALPCALCDVGKEDCLLIISYSRYTKVAYRIAAHFHAVGSPVISITDSLTSPIALKSTQVLQASNGGNFSPVAAITLCNGFITALGRKDTQKTLERMELQEKIALANDVYL